MVDIKEIISILCKYLNGTIGSTLTPQHFKLAKHNKNSNDIINILWNALDKFTYFATKESYVHTSALDYNKCIRTKLRLAYLQYPCLDIFSLSESKTNSSSRVLLIALVWLITNHDVFKYILRLKLLNSPFGTEFSVFNIHNKQEINDAKISTIPNQINNLLQKTNKINNNLKAISELYMTKIKLITKVHAASITASGLPHLTVSEMSLIKKIATNKDSKDVDLEKIKEMEKTALILDMHMQWTKKSHIFYTWMNTVLNEYKKTDTSVCISEGLSELSKFIYLLRHIIKKRIKAQNNDEYFSTENSIEYCPSRLLRVHKNDTEVNTFSNEMKSIFNAVDDSLIKQRLKLEIELKTILDSIPNCVHI